MNLRHAAALALVGWYLMVPPSTGQGPPRGTVYFHLKAPLSEWNQSDEFDAVADCNRERDRRLHLGMKALDVVKAEMEALPDSAKQRFSEEAPDVYRDYVNVYNTTLANMASRCINSDDPRLKDR